MYSFFGVILRRLNFICQHFGTLCLFHLHGRVGMKNDWGWECWVIYRGKGLTRKYNVGELPRRKHTTFRTRRKFEMKNKGIFFKFSNRKREINYCMLPSREANVLQISFTCDFFLNLICVCYWRLKITQLFWDFKILLNIINVIFVLDSVEETWISTYISYR